jgi:hypothetical protein
LVLAQNAFAANADLVLNALNDPKMSAPSKTFYPQLVQVMRTAKCAIEAKSVDCSQATQAQLTAAQSSFDSLSQNVGQAAAFLQASGGLALSQRTFAASIAQLLKGINTVPMNAAARTQFNARFAFDLNEANCTNTANGVDCSKAEQSQLLYAQKLFDTLSAQLSATQP